MPTYFFNIVVNGLGTPDAHGRQLPDEDAARECARQMVVRFSDPRHDQGNGFIAVSGPDHRLLFKAPFPKQSPQA